MATKTVGSTVTRVTMSYDAFGNRIARADGSGTEWYAVDGWDPMKGGGKGTEAFDTWADLQAGGGLLLARRVFGAGWDEVLAKQVTGGVMSWYVTDHQGSVRLTLDTTGAVAGTLAYDAFGKATTATGSVDRYQYTAREWDAAMSLQYSRARWYEPGTARWLAADQMGFAAGDTNLYRYVGNEVTTNTDPSGNFLYTTTDAKDQWVEKLKGYGINADSVELSSRWNWSTRHYINIPHSDSEKLWQFVWDHWGGKGEAEARSIYDRMLNSRDHIDGRANLGTVQQNWADGWFEEAIKFGQSRRGHTINPSVEQVDYTAEFVTGLRNASTVMLNELTFHGFKDLDEESQRLIAEDPNLKVSQVCGIVAREALTTAATGGAGSVVIGGAVKVGGKVGGVIISKTLSAGGQCAVKSGAKVAMEGAKLVFTVHGAVQAGQAANDAYEAIQRGASDQEIAEKLAKGGIAFLQLGYDVKDVARLARNLNKDGFRKYFGSCFAAGTGVMTDRGWVAIEAIRQGDRVWSRSETAAEEEGRWRAVLATMVRSGSVVELRVGDRVIETTAEHPFWVLDRGWVPTSGLKPGDALAGRNGEWTVVESVTETNRFEPVYNFAVEEDHTYFVGGEGWDFSVWAHNTGEGCSVPANGSPEANAAEKGAASIARGAECVNPTALREVAGVNQDTAKYAVKKMRTEGEEAAEEYLTARIGKKRARDAIEASKSKPVEPITDKTYVRPGGTDYRKGEREAVWEAARKASSDGIVRDPVTNRPMKFDEPWEMGHKPKYEFWKLQQSAAQRKLTRQQFLDEYHNPDHFRPELPPSNHGHYGEDKTSEYLGL